MTGSSWGCSAACSTAVVWLIACRRLPLSRSFLFIHEPPAGISCHCTLMRDLEIRWKWLNNAGERRSDILCNFFRLLSSCLHWTDALFPMHEQDQQASLAHNNSVMKSDPPPPTLSVSVSPRQIYMCRCHLCGKISALPLSLLLDLLIFFQPLLSFVRCHFHFAVFEHLSSFHIADTQC